MENDKEADELEQAFGEAEAAKLALGFASIWKEHEGDAGAIFETYNTFHDAKGGVQALGKQHLDFAGSGLDFASLSAHKIGGPAGIGALLVRPGRAMTSLLRGGGQEQGRRSGTENVIGIAGFGGAAKAAFKDIAHYRAMAAWRDGLEARLASQRNDAVLFGAGADRLGNTSCLAIGERSSETMVMALDLAGVAVSAGAACSSGKVHESHVLKAMNNGVHAGCAIRISGGWSSSMADP